MNESNSILVVIDPTVSEQRALDQASILAQSLDKQLKLLICTHDESLKHYQNILGKESITSSVTNLLDKLAHRLELIAEPFRDKGLQVKCDVVWDRPIDEGIIRKALQSKPFMIVKDTHYHPKLARSIFRNTDWSLIRTCPYPILFVKHHKPWNSPVVISAVNPINETEEKLDSDIIQFGELIENKMEATHKVLHICEPLTVFYVGINNSMGYAGSLHDQYDELLDMHKNRLNKLVDDESVDREKVIFMEGNVKHELPNVVEGKSADLIIMGSISRSRLEQVFIGGTAEAVLDEINCDVLVLKPSSFITPVSAQAPPEYPQIVWPM